MEFGRGSVSLIIVPQRFALPISRLIKRKKVGAPQCWQNHPLSSKASTYAAALVVNEALSQVKEIEGSTAEKKVRSFEITGRFNEKDVFMALNEQGLAGGGERLDQFRPKVSLTTIASTKSANPPLR